MYTKGLQVGVGQDFYYVFDGENVSLFDSEGDYQKSFSPNTNPSVIEEWVDGYEQGYSNGSRLGKISGIREVQDKMLSALGISSQLIETQRGIKTIASVLFYHEGICKDDVAGIAGKD